ncbi:MAG: DUF4156 domain-containing protein [Gammaproteobacteria bacterium]|nr:DUF4156 domain-containing protein [Gammaproteobacteria bacterium]
MLRILVLCFVGLTLQACTWVKLTEEGEKARVLSASEVSNCKLVGKTTSVSKATIAGVERNEEKLQKELETLARNSASDLKGDTVVAIDKPVDGKQVFLVYRCVGR